MSRAYERRGLRALDVIQIEARQREARGPLPTWRVDDALRRVILASWPTERDAWVRWAYARNRRHGLNAANAWRGALGSWRALESQRAAHEREAAQPPRAPLTTTACVPDQPPSSREFERMGGRW